MFRQNFKNNLKNKIIYNNIFINNIFNLIEVVIDFNNKLYKKTIKKRNKLILQKNKNFL